MPFEFVEKPRKEGEVLKEPAPRVFFLDNRPADDSELYLKRITPEPTPEQCTDAAKARAEAAQRQREGVERAYSYSPKVREFLLRDAQGNEKWIPRLVAIPRIAAGVAEVLDTKE